MPAERTPIIGTVSRLLNEFVKLKTVIVLTIVLVLFGCDQKAWFEKFMPKEDVEFSKNYLALFQEHDFDAIEAKIDPTLKGTQLRPKLERIASVFPPGKPSDIQTVGAQTFSNPDTTRVSLTFQYAYPGKWLLANVVLQKKEGEVVVAGITVRPLRDSLENINRFSFDGKGITHYAVFALAIAIPLAIVLVTILCIKTPIPKRKWLWVIFVLAGFVEVTLNWTDGNLTVKPISFLLFGAGFSKASPYGPLLLSVSIPIGAIVFLFKRKKWLVPDGGGLSSFPRDDAADARPAVKRD